MTVAHARVPRLVALATQGLTAAQIGARVGLSRQRVQQVLAAAGQPISSVRVPRCADCGVPLPSLQTEGGRAARGAPRRCDACRALHRRVQRRDRARAGRQRAHCAHCGVPLHRYVDPARDRPSWCQAPACAVARQRWKLANDPAFRALVNRHHRDRRRRAKERRLREQRERAA